MTMRNSEITPILSSCIAAIEDGGSDNADFAISRLSDLIRKLRPPEPTLAQQDQVLSAMRCGHHSAAAIKAATGFPNPIIYAARYKLRSRGLIYQYDPGRGPVRWGCDPR